MRLSLSARIVEVDLNRGITEMPLCDFVRLAGSIGYEGVGIRPSQVTPSSPKDEIEALRSALQETGVRVASTFARTCEQKGAQHAAAFDYPETEPEYLDRFIAELRLAERLGAVVMRVPFFSLEQIQKACDLAADSPVKLVYPNHTRSPFETIEGSLESLKKIDRPNFGLTLEAGNLSICGSDYGPEALAKLKDYIFDVAVQNCARVESGGALIPMNRGQVRYQRFPLGDPRGLDYAKFFRGLKEIGYEGYVTLFEPRGEGRDSSRSATEAFEFLSQFP